MPETASNYAYRICLGSRPQLRRKGTNGPVPRSSVRSCWRISRSRLKRFSRRRGLDGIDPSEAAVWVGVSRVLLNLEEFITRG